MGSIVVSPLAQQELDDIWYWIARDSIDAAERHLARLEMTVKKLAQMPGMGQMRDDLSPGVLSFPVANHLILYRRIESGIQVIHFAHGAQQLDRLNYKS